MVKLTRTSSLNRSLSGSISCNRRPVSLWRDRDKDQSTTYAQTLLNKPWGLVYQISNVASLVGQVRLTPFIIRCMLVSLGNYDVERTFCLPRANRRRCGGLSVVSIVFSFRMGNLGQSSRSQNPAWLTLDGGRWSAEAQRFNTK